MRNNAQGLPVIGPGCVDHGEVCPSLFLCSLPRPGQHGGRKIHTGHMTNLRSQGNRQGTRTCTHVQHRPLCLGRKQLQTLSLKGGMRSAFGKGGGALIPYLGLTGFPAGIILCLLPQKPPINVCVAHHTLLFLKTGKYVDRKPCQRVHFLLLGKGFTGSPSSPRSRRSYMRAISRV